MPYPIDMIHCKNAGDWRVTRMLLLFLVIIAANSSLAEDLLEQSVLTHPVQMSHKPRIDIPLIGQNTDGGRFYYVDASFGSPQQKLKLVVDTGSTDTWVYGPSLCKPNGQKTPPLQCYSEADSTSHQPVLEGHSFHAEYRSREKLEGHFVTDQLRIGPSTLQSLRFAVIDTGVLFEGGGVLGLSFNTGEFAEHGQYKYQYPDFLDTAYKDGIIGNNSFALYIRNRGRDMQGVLSIGEIDASRFGTHSVKFKIIKLTEVARLAIPLTKISIQSPLEREDKPWSWSVPTSPSTPHGFHA
ncbi:acid protease [Pyrenochaeta sp. DS3sAY3a]|nr:acid protease [Pyrenochaeta sp. DS3sAY3a]